ncbi:MAG: murein biosynthesis integral membrane protein MurJ [Clostridia bacterium]|nr:murein biosynthesis integral membrane protein MurJ [Clostridia bacterium]
MQEQISYKKAAIVVMIITLLSKITGFFREIALGGTYGATYVTDAYLVSLTIPQVLFASIAAALATAYIPVYSKIKHDKGPEKGVIFTNKVINIVLLVSTVIAVFGIIFAKPIVSIIAMGFKGEALDLAVRFTKITFPMVIFIGLCNIFTSFLQSNNEFALPSLIGIPYNIIIISALLLSSILGPYGLVYGTLCGVVVEVLILLIGALRKGYRYEGIIDFKDPNVIKVVSLSFPVMLGAAVQQVNVIVDRMLASGLPEGSISALNFANRLNGFAYGLFSMSIAVVIFPLLSRLTAENDMENFKDKLIKSLNVITLIMLPITVGAVVLRQPIVSLLFERGQFDSRATVMTASALMFYSLGMVFYGYRDVLNRAFYSFQDTKTPMINGVITVGLNIMLNIVLVKYMQHNGLALATSLSAAVMTLLLMTNLRKKIAGIGGRKLRAVFLKSAAASLLMGLAVYGFSILTAEHIVSSGKLIGLLILGLEIGFGALLYFALVYIFKVGEVNWFITMVRNKIRNF